MKLSLPVTHHSHPKLIPFLFLPLQSPPSLLLLSPTQTALKPSQFTPRNKQFKESPSTELRKMAAARGHFNLTARTLPEPHQHSAWHSPVPYLFAGLAVMLGLVAFALLILACSYWKLSGHFDARNDGDSSQNQRDLEAGAEEEERADRGGEKKEKALEEKIVVIVAGRANTMFLATPILSPSSSDVSTSTSTSSNCRTRLSCFEESECGSDGDRREKLAVGEAEIASKHGESDRVDHSRELENQDGPDRRS